MSNTEWKEYEMSELIEEISMGPFGSNIKVECFTDSGIPVLNGSNLVGFRLNEASFNYVTEEKATSLGRANAYRGDIVITHRGTLGQIVFIPQNSKFERYVISQSQFRIRCNEKVLPEYLVYYFHSREGQYKLLSNASQVGVPSLARPTTTFQKLKVTIPSVAEQERIVKILGSLDDKIELNDAISKNLEEQAQAIFKNWFVDFAPFGGKMPEGWKEGTVADIIVTHDSKRIPLSGMQRNAMKKIYPYYGATSCMDYVDHYIFDGIYLLLGEDGTVIDENGFPILQYVEGKFWVNNHAHILTGQNGYSVEMLYLFFSLTSVREIVTGAVQPKISQGRLNSLAAIIPDCKTAKEFDEMIQPVFAQIRTIRNENQRLTSLRDTLLPKLMSDKSAKAAAVKANCKFNDCASVECNSLRLIFFTIFSKLLLNEV